jgi:hypothetical protein
MVEKIYKMKVKKSYMDEKKEIDVKEMEENINDIKNKKIKKKKMMENLLNESDDNERIDVL